VVVTAERSEENRMGISQPVLYCLFLSLFGSEGVGWGNEGVSALCSTGIENVETPYSEMWVVCFRNRLE